MRRAKRQFDCLRLTVATVSAQWTASHSPHMLHKRCCRSNCAAIHHTASGPRTSFTAPLVSNTLQSTERPRGQEPPGRQTTSQDGEHVPPAPKGNRPAGSCYTPQKDEKHITQATRTKPRQTKQSVQKTAKHNQTKKGHDRPVTFELKSTSPKWYTCGM